MLADVLLWVGTFLLWIGVSLGVSLAARNMFKQLQKAFFPKKATPGKPERYELVPHEVMAVQFLGRPMDGVCLDYRCDIISVPSPPAVWLHFNKGGGLDSYGKREDLGGKP